MKPSMLESRFWGNARLLTPSHRHGMMHARLGRSIPRIRAQSTAPVRISVKRETKPGERVVVLGNVGTLGNWDMGKALCLKWTEGHVWCQTCEVPIDEEVEFKLVELKEDDGTMTWEDGNNRLFKALGADHSLEVMCEWDETGSTHIEAKKIGEGKEELMQQVEEPARIHALNVWGDKNGGDGMEQHEVEGREMGDEDKDKEKKDKKVEDKKEKDKEAKKGERAVWRTVQQQAAQEAELQQQVSEATKRADQVAADATAAQRQQAAREAELQQQVSEATQRADQVAADAAAAQQQQAAREAELQQQVSEATKRADQVAADATAAQQQQAAREAELQQLVSEASKRADQVAADAAAAQQQQAAREAELQQQVSEATKRADQVAADAAAAQQQQVAREAELQQQVSEAMQQADQVAADAAAAQQQQAAREAELQRQVSEAEQRMDQVANQREAEVLQTMVTRVECGKMGHGREAVQKFLDKQVCQDDEGNLFLERDDEEVFSDERRMEEEERQREEEWPKEGFTARLARDVENSWATDSALQEEEFRRKVEAKEEAKEHKKQCLAAAAEIMELAAESLPSRGDLLAYCKAHGIKHTQRATIPTLCTAILDAHAQQQR